MPAKPATRSFGASSPEKAGSGATRASNSSTGVSSPIRSLTHSTRPDLDRRVAYQLTGSDCFIDGPPRDRVTPADGLGPMPVGGTRVRRSRDPSHFEVLPKRWIVGRTWSWLMNSGRLQVDYERDPIVMEGFIWAAHSRYLLRRLTEAPIT